MLEITVDTSGLDAKVIRLAAFTGKTVEEAQIPEARLLGVQMARYTQPFDFGDSSKKLGEGAVERDVRRAFYVLPNDLVANPVMIKSGQYAGWLRLFSTTAGVAYAVQSNNFRVQDSSQTLYRHHQTLRNRSGNVPKKSGWIDQQARFVAINMWVISQSQFDDYLPFIQKEVGFAKGGWATAIADLGGTRGLPGWVTRHKNKAPGRSIIKKGENPTVTIINDIDYTSQVLSQSGQRGAIRDAEFRLAKRIQNALDHPPKDK